jgi:hypothetical protein
MDKPFDVNFILALPHDEDFERMFEKRVPVVSFFRALRQSSPITGQPLQGS